MGLSVMVVIMVIVSLTYTALSIVFGGTIMVVGVTNLSFSLQCFRNLQPQTGQYRKIFRASGLGPGRNTKTTSHITVEAQLQGVLI